MINDRAGATLRTAHNLGTLDANSKSFGENLSQADPIDLYRIKLTRSSQLQTTIKGLKADVILQLLNRQGKILQTRDRRGIRAESITDSLTAGVYYLRVKVKGRGKTAYKLNVSASLAQPNYHLIPGSSLNGDGINAEEQTLYQLVNQYRAQNGLPSIPLSKALSIVANRHVIDLEQNDVVSSGRSLHSWSDAPYDANVPNTYPSMWEAPQRLKTGYPGNGFENAFGGSGSFVATADNAMTGWKNSSAHNAVILNQGVWTNFPWNAIGVGIYGSFAVLWFGNEVDPTGLPPSEP